MSIDVTCNIHGATGITASARESDGTSWLTLAFTNEVQDIHEITLFVPLAVAQIYAAAINAAHRDAPLTNGDVKQLTAEGRARDEVLF